MTQKDCRQNDYKQTPTESLGVNLEVDALLPVNHVRHFSQHLHQGLVF
jgi:hypothetical protein